MKKLRVAILGTGPSAAYAIKACDACKVDSEVISSTSPPIFYPGAFWPRSNPLEKDMPLYNVYISSVGTAEKYLEKQWGEIQPEWLEETSFPKESTIELALNPYELFGEIWEYRNIYLSGPLSDDRIALMASEYDVIFMTFPTQKSTKLREDNLVKFPIVSYKSNETHLGRYCIYDGESHDNMVRMSSLFGFIHCEYGKDYIPRVELIESGKVTWARDLAPDTPEWDPEDTPAENVHLIGRHAQWSRKKLAHHAFDDVIAILEKIL